MGLLLSAAGFSGCRANPDAARREQPPSLSRAALPAASVQVASVAARPVRKRRPPKPAPGAEKAAAPASKPAEAACPGDMALVAGNHCRSVEQRCLEYKMAQGAVDENRCLKFEQPTQCVSTAPEPRRMRFCMDRHEYPNRVGELPMTLVDWAEATRLCTLHGKRLCTESEFTFACEGEQMQPYAVGFERPTQECNIDHPYSKQRFKLLPSLECDGNAGCRRERERLDRRGKIGERPGCVSPFGVFDLNGNVNEWVAQPWKDPPHRSALKGGWWGPVRNRCRAIAQGHDEKYFGYEVGFRCCKDAPPAPRR